VTDTVNLLCGDVTALSHLCAPVQSRLMVDVLVSVDP
jgi:hypothetical protein